MKETKIILYEVITCKSNESGMKSIQKDEWENTPENKEAVKLICCLLNESKSSLLLYNKNLSNLKDGEIVYYFDSIEWREKIDGL